MSFLVAIAVAVLLVMAVRRELRPHGLDPRNPMRLSASGVEYDVHTTTGRVAGATKYRERHIVGHVSGSTDGYIRDGTGRISGWLSGRIRSYTTIHDQFFLADANGTEHPVKVTDMDLVLRDGHLLSAVWAIRQGDERGPYLLFRNHTTRGTDFHVPTAKKLLGTRGLQLVALVYLLTASVSAGIAEFATDDSFGLIWATALVVAAIFGLPITGGVAIGAKVATDRRIERFVDAGCAPLVDRLDTAAHALPSAPTATTV